MCHFEGYSVMHSMETNDEIFYYEYEKFKPFWIPMKNITWKCGKYPPRGCTWELEAAIWIGERIGAWRRREVP